MSRRHYGLTDRLLGEYAWYLGNSKERAWPVGSLLPNDLGLFDALGNMYEWCQDAYYETSRTDSQTTEHINENNRVLRGGGSPIFRRTSARRGVTRSPRRAAAPTSVSVPPGLTLESFYYFTLGAAIQSANRNRNAPSNRDTNNGFRSASTWQQGVHPVPPEFERFFLSKSAAKSRSPSRAG